MQPIPLTEQELESIHPGEALTLATVMLVFTIAIMAVVAFKLFTSKGAKLSLPGGYSFQWN